MNTRLLSQIANLLEAVNGITNLLEKDRSSFTHPAATEQYLLYAQENLTKALNEVISETK